MSCTVAADVTAGLIGDPTRLHQVLLNLIGSAIKFTEAGAVSLEVTSAGAPAVSGGDAFQAAG